MTEKGGFDIIGDVHGCALSLRLLLDRLGYREIQGVYRHPSRRVIFVGDIIDRGPRIREALAIVYAMVESGQAHMVMGNHEYNYIGYHTPAPKELGRPYLKPRDARHTRVLEATLEQLAHYPEEQRIYLEWFKQRPVFLEFAHFRVIHACWHPQLIKHFKQCNGANCMQPDFLERTAKEDNPEHRLIDVLLRGTQLSVPDQQVIIGRDGVNRRFFRTKFWHNNPHKYADIVFQPDPLPDSVAQKNLTDEDRLRLLCYSEFEKPLFFGHYWCQGQPRALAANLACLDYSAVKRGKLVAYRMDDEARIQNSKFVWVDVAAEIDVV